MLTLRRVIETNSKEYNFIEGLLTTSFPEDEYRDLEEQRNNTCSNKYFNLMLATKEENAIGFISYWAFDTFCYVEHLAIHPQMRNKGYGNIIIKELQRINKTIVLEAELPINELTKRRVEFYKRLGFTTFNNEYIQPAYRADSNQIPMFLMYWQKEITNISFETTRNTIYKNVYNSEL